MIISDLAMEFSEKSGKIYGVFETEKRFGSVLERTVRITDETASGKIGKACGIYVTEEVPAFGNFDRAISLRLKEKIEEFVFVRARAKRVLVAGLGNENMACDALGASVVDHLLCGKGGRAEVFSVKPGVEGMTGISSFSVISGVVKEISPDLLICIDALVANDMERLHSVYQLSDSGIYPGSGTGKRREEISKKTVGIPVLSCGVPFAVSCRTVARAVRGFGFDKSDRYADYIVCPRGVDMLVRRSAAVIADGLNFAFHPELNAEGIRTAVCGV